MHTGTTRLCDLTFKLDFQLPLFVFFYMQNTWLLQYAKSLIYQQSHHQALNPRLSHLYLVQVQMKLHADSFPSVDLKSKTGLFVSHLFGYNDETVRMLQWIFLF